MKSDILVSLIKEIVKNEVKNQVKEELVKLVKSGAVTLNSKKQSTTPTLSESVKPKVKPNVVARPKVEKQYTNNAMLNEILNQTTPFTAAQKAEGGPAMGATGGSILDAIQPSVSMEDDWETMDYRTVNMPQEQPNIDGVSDEYVNALSKALTRDYRELVKRF
jgi:hypothetical protein